MDVRTGELREWDEALVTPFVKVDGDDEDVAELSARIRAAVALDDAGIEDHRAAARENLERLHVERAKTEQRRKC